MLARALLASTFATSPTLAAPRPLVHVEVLPRPATAQATALAVDDDGRVFGVVAVGGAEPIRAATWTDGDAALLAPIAREQRLNGATSGVAVGYAVDVGLRMRGVHTAVGALAFLPGPEGDASRASAINAAGVVVGSAGRSACLWPSVDASPIALPSPPGTTDGLAVGVNAARDVVGTAWGADDETGRAVVWHAATAWTPVELSPWSSAHDIATDGRIVGGVRDGASEAPTVWTPIAGGGPAAYASIVLTDTAGAPARGLARAVNDDGLVVGTASGADGEHAAAWLPDGAGGWSPAIDLAVDGIDGVPTDVNADGVIVGFARADAVRWTLEFVAAAVARPDAYDAAKGVALTIAAPGVLGDDGGADVLTAELVAAPRHGTVQLAADGSFVYLPAPGFVGVDVFTYAADDGGGASPPVDVQIEVVDRAPRPVDDRFVVHGAADGAARSIAAPGPLANDVDPDGDALALVPAVTTTAAGGTLVVAADGALEYAPPPGFTGDDAATIQVADGAATTPSTVAFAVVDAAPRTVDDRLRWRPRRGAARVVAAPGLLANDVDDDGDPLAAVSVVDERSAHGSFTLAADGALRYAPDEGFVGLDVVPYAVVDGLAPPAAGLATIVVADAAPRPASDAFVVARRADGTAHLVVPSPGVLANDVDDDGDALVVVAARVATAAGGVAVLGADGSLDYLPPAGFVGVDEVTYVVDDEWLTASARVRVFVEARVSPPPAPPAPSQAAACAHAPASTMGALSILVLLGRRRRR